MKAVRWILVISAVVAITAFVFAGVASAASLPAIVTHGDVAVVHGDSRSGTTPDLADYLLIIAGVGAWATFSVWLAMRHRRRLTADWGRAAAAVGDEAEEWLRDQ